MRLAQLYGRFVGLPELMEFVFSLVIILRQLRDIRESYAQWNDIQISYLGEQRDTLLALIKGAEREAKNFELDAALDRIARVRQSVDTDAKVATIIDHLRVLIEVMEDQLTRRHSVYIPLRKYEFYFDIATLFPRVVQDAFPSIVQDVGEACSAYALDLNTACVYHSMGIVQRGLHAMAKELNVPFSATLDLENWKNIIDQIESKIRELEKLPKSPDKDAKITFYSKAAVQFRYFNDDWRNHVDHNREEYDADQAHSILIHARDFVKELAENGLKE